MKDVRKEILLAAAVTFALAIMILTGIYRCPLVFLTGIPCPFCGMSRAFISVLSGKIGESFYYHPLWPLVPVVLIINVLYELRVIKISDRVYNAAALLLAAALLACFVIRHIAGSPIVKVDLSSSVIAKLLGYLRPD